MTSLTANSAKSAATVATSELEQRGLGLEQYVLKFIVFN